MHFRRKLLEAVKFLHEINVTHGDLKPDNILIHDKECNTEDRFNPIIIDFGQANRLVSFGGTACYQPPEQFDINHDPYSIDHK